jgi:hypothetical protein
MIFRISEAPGKKTNNFVSISYSANLREVNLCESRSYEMKFSHLNDNLMVLAAYFAIINHTDDAVG